MIKFICLVFVLMFTAVNLSRMFLGQGIPRGNFLIWSVATAGFIWLQWLS